MATMEPSEDIFCQLSSAQKEALLLAAAGAGDVEKLYHFIVLEPEILERFDTPAFCHTPLHAAVMEAQSHFAMQILYLKPSFAEKLNLELFSPLHLAVINLLNASEDTRKDHHRMVRLLLTTNGELARVKGKWGDTPFLYAVEHNGGVTLINGFLVACPECMEDVNIKGETALHIAVKNNNFEVFQVLLKHLYESLAEKVMKLRDENAKTVWHLAVSIHDNQSQFLEKLLEVLPDEFYLRNLEDLMPMLTPEEDQFMNIFCKLSLVKQLTVRSKRLFSVKTIRSMGRNLPEGKLNAFLVVFGLMATSTYQTAFNAPRLLTFTEDDGIKGTVVKSSVWLMISLLFGSSILLISGFLPSKGRHHVTGSLVLFTLSYFTFLIFFSLHPLNVIVQLLLFFFICLSLNMPM